MEDYQTFLNKLQKRGSKPHKLSHCLGSRDAWKYIRKNKWKYLGGNPCDQSLYSKIISTVNKYLAEQLLEGHTVEFSCNMGSINVASVPSRVYMKEGELVNNYRTDWKKTLDLWYEDEEARNSHKTVKRIQKRIYLIKYNKEEARFHNMRFYSFRANRSLAKTLGREIEKRKIISEHIDY